MVQNNNYLKGVAYIIAAFFLLSLYGVFNKILFQTEGILWINFLTFLIGFIGLIPIAAYQGFSNFKTKAFSLHLLRAVVGVLASYLYFLSLTRVPLANATLLYSTTPIFLPIVAYLIYRSRISMISWLAIIAGFIGIGIILRPNLGTFDQIGNVYGLMGGMALAIVFVTVRQMVKTEPIIRIIFYFSGLGALLQLPFAVGYAHSLQFIQYLFIVGIAATFFCSQYLIGLAYKYAPPTKVGVFQYLMILFVGMFDWMLWGVVPSPIDWLGTTIVIAAGITAVREGIRTE